MGTTKMLLCRREAVCLPALFQEFHHKNVALQARSRMPARTVPRVSPQKCCSAGEKPYACPHCSKSFTTKMWLCRREAVCLPALLQEFHHKNVALQARSR